MREFLHAFVAAMQRNDAAATKRKKFAPAAVMYASNAHTDALPATAKEDAAAAKIPLELVRFDEILPATLSIGVRRCAM